MVQLRGAPRALFGKSYEHSLPESLIGMYAVRIL